MSSSDKSFTGFEYKSFDEKFKGLVADSGSQMSRQFNHTLYSLSAVAPHGAHTVCLFTSTTTHTM